MRSARRLATPLALALAFAFAQTQPGTAADGLTDRYPLGERALESRPSARVPPSAERPAAADPPPADDGPVTTVMLIAIGAAALVAVAAAAAREAREVGWVARSTARPRRPVTPRTYRLARLLGFRYSRSRDALVLRGVGQRFGPVLTCRSGPRRRPPPRPRTGVSRLWRAPPRRRRRPRRPAR